MSSDLSQNDFEYFKDLIQRLAGIHLLDSKKDLVKSRLRAHIQKMGLDSYGAYVSYLEGLRENDSEFQCFINLLTTNKTDFFREPAHFHFLSDHIKREYRNEKGEIDIWCCASSTGEEPYTLSLVLNDTVTGNLNYRILATDIDTEVLKKAENGVYENSKLVEIPDDYKKTGVILGRDDVSGWFKISDRIRDHIEFKKHNLVERTYPNQKRFDFIFCRNVLIYFSAESIRTLARKLHGCLKKDGILFIGHSENIQGCGEIFEIVRPSVYRKLG